MFLPSEAVYAELHARPPEECARGFDALPDRIAYDLHGDPEHDAPSLKDARMR
jgi:hypothetical protein